MRTEGIGASSIGDAIRPAGPRGPALFRIDERYREFFGSCYFKWLGGVGLNRRTIKILGITANRA